LLRTVFRHPRDYGIRANLMWAATMALNGLVGAGAAHDWASHTIGHELTAFYGMDHGQTLAVISPSILRYKKDKKKAMLVKYARNVWNIQDEDEDRAAEASIRKTVEFWNLIGVKTRLTDYRVGDERFAEIAARVCAGGNRLGEHEDIGPQDVVNILKMSL
jgi:NADP-dependent alcohol dehydrogenase